MKEEVSELLVRFPTRLTSNLDVSRQAASLSVEMPQSEVAWHNIARGLLADGSVCCVDELLKWRHSEIVLWTPVVETWSVEAERFLFQPPRHSVS